MDVVIHGMLFAQIVLLVLSIAVSSGLYELVIFQVRSIIFVLHCMGVLRSLSVCLCSVQALCNASPRAFLTVIAPGAPLFGTGSHRRQGALSPSSTSYSRRFSQANFIGWILFHLAPVAARPPGLSQDVHHQRLGGNSYLHIRTSSFGRHDLRMQLHGRVCACVAVLDGRFLVIRPDPHFKAHILTLAAQLGSLKPRPFNGKRDGHSLTRTYLSAPPGPCGSPGQ